MKLAVPKESRENEQRVALVPDSVKKLKAKGIDVIIEADAGRAAGFLDADYEKAGATIKSSYSEVIADAEVVVKVRAFTPEEAKGLKNETAAFAIHDALQETATIDVFKEKQIIAFAMEFIPRITLAQSMDVLSSMATIAGYRAVLIASSHFGQLFPMLMTAAGTIPPARVLILGAGVAGLQAIATAKRLGAVVEAFDLRPEVKEQVMSLGAKFVEMPEIEDASDDQGYAKEVSEEFIKKEMELIDKHLSKSDICITTAQVFGRKAPTLIKDYMVENMKPGSVIVDLASEQGGNCTLSKPGEVVTHSDVKIVGPLNIASDMATDASKMYSKNIENLLLHLLKEDKLDFNPEDEIVSRSLVTRSGEMVSEIVKKFKG